MQSQPRLVGLLAAAVSAAVGILGTTCAIQAQCVLSFAAALNNPTATAPNFVVSGDFNGDGHPDLAVSNLSSNNVSILLGSATGTFQAAVNYPVGSFPDGIAVADFNGDGRPDLAVANASGGGISILLGSGNGSFLAAVNYTVGANCASIAVGDFNDDGRPDLAVTNYGGGHNYVSILLGVGNGTFQAPVNYNVGNGPDCVVVGDFNGDGRPDLAVANGNGTTVSILTGNANGTFQAAVNYNVGNSPKSIAVGDFNADGRPDLAVSNGNSNNVSILLGNAAGTFQPSVNYPVGNSPLSVAVGDFNGDSRTDLVVVDQLDATISVLLGNGNGTFQAATNFVTGSSPQTVAVADFNSDSRPDLAVVLFGNTVSTIMNTSFASFPSPTITQQPLPQLVQAGASAVFTVAAVGNGNPQPLAYQWRRNGTPLVNGGNISGVATSTLTISPATPADTASYDVLVSSPACSGAPLVTSSTAGVLAVADQCAGEVPVITSQPTGQNAQSGATVGFSMVASSPPQLGPVTYQWRRNGIALANGGGVLGCTSQFLTLSGVATTDSGAAFDCVVTNSCGSARSDPAGLSVHNQCGSADFNGDGDLGTDADIESFFRVLGGGNC